METLNSGMNFRYPNITAGYLGIKVEKQNLNGAFFSEIFSANQDFSRSIVFPQRVPQHDFFAEILLLENSDVAQALKNFQMLLINKTRIVLSDLDKNGKNSREFLNFLNILLRYGLLNEIAKIDSVSLSHLLNPSDFIELELIKEIAATRLHGEEEFNSRIENLKNLADKALENSDLTERVQILILNYLIVAAYRFNAKLPYHGCLKECHEKLTNLVSTIQSTTDFGTIIRASVAYRGLAMVREIDVSQKDKFLKEALSLARNMKPTKKHEQLVVNENLYTCLQTLTKWYLYLKLPEAAENTLLEMINLDPFDSTGYGEMGFLLLNQERYDTAAKYFQQAAKLGPPVVGMHTYYYAKCLQATDQTEDAIRALYEATKLDEEAVSPWLDLVDYHLSVNQHDKAQNIAKFVLNKSVYKEQLQEDEALKLITILND